MAGKHLKLTWYGETYMLSATKLIKKYPFANHNVQLVTYPQSSTRSI